MLHAQLHHKLDESIPEPQRLEDALTSTVIGTLALVEAADVLAAWLAEAESTDGSALGQFDRADHFECWFWPHLVLAEPDVLIRLGDRLFIIEAKYRSGKHDKHAVDPGEDEEEDIVDQLRREWASAEPHRPEIATYPISLRSAIRECRKSLVYLVDRRRTRRAWRDLRKSAKGQKEAQEFRFLTWQQLHAILIREMRTRSTGVWFHTLSAYLEMCGLAAFAGFRTAVTGQSKTMMRLSSWRGGTSSVRPVRIREAAAAAAAAGGERLLAVVRGWRTRRDRMFRPQLRATVDPVRNVGVERLAIVCRRLCNRPDSGCRHRLSRIRSAVIPISRLGIDRIRAVARHFGERAGQ